MLSENKGTTPATKRLDTTISDDSFMGVSELRRQPQLASPNITSVESEASYQPNFGRKKVFKGKAIRLVTESEFGGEGKKRKLNKIEL